MHRRCWVGGTQTGRPWHVAIVRDRWLSPIISATVNLRHMLIAESGADRGKSYSDHLLVVAENMTSYSQNAPLAFITQHSGDRDVQCCQELVLTAEQLQNTNQDMPLSFEGPHLVLRHGHLSHSST